MTTRTIKLKKSKRMARLNALISKMILYQAGVLRLFNPIKVIRTQNKKIRVKLILRKRIRKRKNEYNKI